MYRPSVVYISLHSAKGSYELRAGLMVAGSSFSPSQVKKKSKETKYTKKKKRKFIRNTINRKVKIKANCSYSYLLSEAAIQG